MQNILVSIDFSDMTEQVIERAAGLAETFGSTVRLIHVAAPDPSIASSKLWPQEVRDELARELFTEHDEMEELAVRLRERGIEAKGLLARGDVAETILALADKSATDLIIVGAHRKGALSELLPGGVVRSVIRRARCPVLVVPDVRPSAEEPARDANV